MSIWSEYFSRVPDPRRQTGLTKHLLSDILGIALCAMLCGADDFVEFALFGQRRQEFLQREMGFVLPCGVPSHDTFTRVFAHLEPEVLEECLWSWLQHWQCAEGASAEGAGAEGQVPLRHLSIDGKVARGTWQHQNNVCALTTVSVFVSELRLSLCCGRLPAQGGENVLASSLLELLDLEGAVVTGDAAYCQKEVARTVCEQKGDYVFCLKANHRTLYNHIKDAFGKDNKEEEIEGEQNGHGRCEKRRVTSRSLAELGLEAKVVAAWPGLQSVVCVDREREIVTGQKAGTLSISRWFYLSSLAPESSHLAETIRAHWSIENQCHWVLDVVFGEDRCRTRCDHAPYNLALLRRITLNLLRQNQGKLSLKAIRKAVAWDQQLLQEILATPLALL